MVKSNEVTLEKALSIAKSHHISGNLTLADRTYKDIIKIYPEDFTSLHYLGIIAYQRGAPKEGVEFLKKAININEDNHETWNAYAVMLEMTGEKEKAFKAWKKALKLKPDYPDALSNYANGLWNVGEFKKAQKMCEEALKINPTFFNALINLGTALQSQGKIQEAADSWTKAIESNPNHPVAYSNLGNALRDLGRIQESEEYCRKALALSPNYPDAMLNLSNALSDQGNHEEAEKILRQITAIQPNFIRAHSNLAVTLMGQLRYDEALTSARYAVAFDPNFGEAYGHIAVCLRELGQLKESEEIARKALYLNPDSAEAKIDLAETLLLTDNYDEAATLFNEAKEGTPNNPRLYIKLSVALDRANRHEEAIDALNKAVELNPEMPEPYLLKAGTYLTANESEKALGAVDQALKIKPDYVEALSIKSEILQTQGNMEAAKKVIEDGIKINNQIPSLYFTLCKLKKFTKDDGDIKVMQDLADNINKFGRAHAPALFYALFKAYEDIGDYDKAFESLAKGADYKRSNVLFDKVSQDMNMESFKQAATKEKIKEYKGKGCKSDVPVFIVGMPRSGTTLTEQIISSHPDVYGAGELYTLSEIDRNLGVLTPENAKEWGQYYVDEIKSINEKTKSAKRITDKMPGNYVRIGQIVSALPNAKIIHCQRNAIDTCLSCYKQLFTRGHYWSYNQEELVEQYKKYDAIMEYWRKTIPTENFLEIKYEDTINDFENQARELIDFVGLEWNDACLKPHKQKRDVLTASKGQVIKPIYKTSIEAWRRYEKKLQPLVNGLKDFV